MTNKPTPMPKTFEEFTSGKDVVQVKRGKPSRKRREKETLSFKKATKPMRDYYEERMQYHSSGGGLVIPIAFIIFGIAYGYIILKTL